MDCLRLWDLVKRRAESQASVSGEPGECHQVSLPSQGTFKAVRLAQCFWRPYKKEKVTSAMPAAANMPMDACPCPAQVSFSVFVFFFFKVIFEFFKKQHSLNTRQKKKKNKQNVNFISVWFSQCVPVKERLRRNCFQISASEQRCRLVMLLFPLLQLFSISECF